MPIIIKSKQPACNSTVCEFPSLYGSAYCSQCRLSTKVLLIFVAISSSQWSHSGDHDPSLLQTALASSATCRSTKSTKKSVHCCCKETRLLLLQMQLFQLTVKTQMMTILHSPTLLTRKHHKRHQIQQTTNVTWKCCSFWMIARLI